MCDRHADRLRRASPGYKSADGDREDREYKNRGLRTSEPDGDRLKPQDHMRQIMRAPSAASKKSPHLRPAAGIGARTHPQHADRSSAQVASVLTGLGDQGAGGEVSGIDGIVSSGHRYTHTHTHTGVCVYSATPRTHTYTHTNTGVYVYCATPRARARAHTQASAASRLAGWVARGAGR
jgi:hypothetical protein